MQSATAAQQLREELSEEKSNHDITKSKLSKVSEEFENAKKVSLSSCLFEITTQKLSVLVRLFCCLISFGMEKAFFDGNVYSFLMRFVI